MLVEWREVEMCQLTQVMMERSVSSSWLTQHWAVIVTGEMKAVWRKQSEVNGSIPLAVLMDWLSTKCVTKAPPVITSCHLLRKWPAWLAGTTTPGDPAATAAPSEPNLCRAWNSDCQGQQGQSRSDVMAGQDLQKKKNPCRYCWKICEDPWGFLSTLALGSNGNSKFYYIFYKHRSQNPMVQTHHYHLTDGVAEA